jgi:hypothetical protein
MWSAPSGGRSAFPLHPVCEDGGAVRWSRTWRSCRCASAPLFLSGGSAFTEKRRGPTGTVYPLTLQIGGSNMKDDGSSTEQQANEQYAATARQMAEALGVDQADFLVLNVQGGKPSFRPLPPVRHQTPATAPRKAAVTLTRARGAGRPAAAKRTASRGGDSGDSGLSESEEPPGKRGRCKLCGKELPKRRRKYCSDLHAGRYRQRRKRERDQLAPPKVPAKPLRLTCRCNGNHLILEPDRDRCFRCGRQRAVV